LQAKRVGLERVIKRINEIQERFCPNEAPKQEKKRERFVDVLSRVERESSLDVNVLPEKENSKIPTSENVSLNSIIKRHAKNYNVDENLIRAVIKMESGGKTDAVSPKGAMGLMQLMPGTARMLGVNNPYNPDENIEGGVKYLAFLSDKYKGDLEQALAAYNAGPSRVDSYGGIPPFPETQQYVQNVLAEYKRNIGSE
jgi:soluble lytic murein transglycosylase-like protein